MKKAVLFIFWCVSNPSFMYPCSNAYCFTLLLTLGLVCSSYTMYRVTLLGYFSMYSVSPINLSLFLFLLSWKVQYSVLCFCFKQSFYCLLSFFFNSLVVQSVLFNSDLFLIFLVFLLLLLLVSFHCHHKSYLVCFNILNLLRLILWPKILSTLDNVPIGKNVCSMPVSGMHCRVTPGHPQGTDIRVITDTQTYSCSILLLYA